MNFDDCFNQLMVNEGIYSDDEHDSGGKTKYGITEQVARDFGYKGEMRDLPLSVAKDIAKSWYWNKFHCEEMDGRIAFHIFDTAYNGGYPIKWLQRALGVNDDGKFGDLTRAALVKADIPVTIIEFNMYRLRYLISLSAWKYFGKGWAIRLMNNMLFTSAH